MVLILGSVALLTTAKTSVRTTAEASATEKAVSC
jgi:hypothetical protein